MLHPSHFYPAQLLICLIPPRAGFKTGDFVNPFTTGIPFLGTKLLGFRIERGSGAPKGKVGGATVEPHVCGVVRGSCLSLPVTIIIKSIMRDQNHRKRMMFEQTTPPLIQVTK